MRKHVPPEGRASARPGLTLFPRSLALRLIRMARVTLKNVLKIYPGDEAAEVTAVNDVSLEIADREFVVLVGPPGCGKSTILRMIAGLEKISKGEIHISDK